MVCSYKPEDNLVELDLSFHLCMGSGNELRPSDLRSKHLHLLNTLSSFQVEVLDPSPERMGGKTHGFNTGSFLMHGTSLYFFIKVNSFYLNKFP